MRISDKFPYEFLIYHIRSNPPPPPALFWKPCVFKSVFLDTLNKVRKQAIMLIAKRLVVESQELTPTCNVIQMKMNHKQMRGFGVIYANRYNLHIVSYLYVLRKNNAHNTKLHHACV
jgi:predicted nucleic acid-binding protein